jgi:Cytochrome c
MMTAFVKRLGSPGLYEKAAGDAISGRTIYEGKGNCATCHSIGRNGGSLGPDLNDVGRRRTLQYLEEWALCPRGELGQGNSHLTRLPAPSNGNTRC